MLEVLTLNTVLDDASALLIPPISGPGFPTVHGNQGPLEQLWLGKRKWGSVSVPGQVCPGVCLCSWVIVGKKHSLPPLSSEGNSNAIED